MDTTASLSGYYAISAHETTACSVEWCLNFMSISCFLLQITGTTQLTTNNALVSVLKSDCKCKCALVYSRTKTEQTNI
jgi:hypothetical protein